MSEERRRASHPRWSSLSLAYTTLASILFLFAPLSVQQSSARSGPYTAHLSLPQAAGAAAPEVALVLLLPVTVALAPIVTRHSRHVRTVTITAAVVLTAMVILAAASVGLYYAPGAGLMIAAAIKERPERRSTPLGFRTPLGGGEPEV